MAPVLPATRRRQHVYDDSQRWERFTPRPDDIFITTPPKSGTTWMQGIVVSLLWPHGDAPAPAFELSPWLDARIVPLDDWIARVDAIHTDGSSRRTAQPTARRSSLIAATSPSIRTGATHSSHSQTTARDAAGSDRGPQHHRSPGRRRTMATGVGWRHGPTVRRMGRLGDAHGAPGLVVAERHERFVLLVHYADLIRDLGGEMRRIADLDVDIPPALWSEVVGRCRFEAMKSQHEVSAILKQAFPEGATVFFNQGTNGRWRAQLSEAQLRRHQQLAAQRLPEDAALWARAWLPRPGQRP